MATTALSLFGKKRDQLEGLLWRTQLQFRPDSRRVPISEVYRVWLPEDHPSLHEDIEQWEKLYGPMCNGFIDRRVALAAYVEKRNLEHRLRIATSLAMILQYPAFVFYECGKIGAGEYQFRGCRVGLEEENYICGFGRY